jgi:hypothetical protein
MPASSRVQGSEINNINNIHSATVSNWDWVMHVPFVANVRHIRGQT